MSDEKKIELMAKAELAALQQAQAEAPEPVEAPEAKAKATRPAVRKK